MSGLAAREIRLRGKLNDKTPTGLVVAMLQQ